MNSRNPRWIKVSTARRLVIDLLHVCRRTPLIPIERQMNLAPLARIRGSSECRPSWIAIFVKAFAIVARRQPELRQLFMSWPVPRLYEHPESVAAVIVERDLDGEPAILPALLKDPDSHSIRDLDRWLKDCKNQPVGENGSFRRALRISRMPLPLRRMLWWLGYAWWGRTRAKVIGTFGVSVTAGFGASTLAVRGPMTAILHYGQFDSHHTLPVRMTFDHRVFDGATAARALVALEESLLGEVLEELRGLSQRAA